MKYRFIPVICLIFASILLFLEKKKKPAAALCLKALASLSFVLLGYLGSRFSQNTQVAGYILKGLYLGCAADVLLGLRNAFPKIGQEVFLSGTFVFLAGHVMYIFAVVQKCGNAPVWVISGILLAFLLIYWIFTKIQADRIFKLFGVFYLSVIMIMTSVSCGALIATPSAFTLIFAVGALFFLISDIILILNNFGPKSRFSLNILNIMLYYTGQLMIASSLQFV